MTLVALANALLGDRMVERFHADPRVQATELLLQERVPRQAPIIEPRPLDETRVAGAAAAVPVRRFRSPHTRLPARAVPVERQLRRRRSPTPAAAPASAAGCAVTRIAPRRRRAIPAASSSTCATCAAARCGRPTYQPTRREPDDYLVDVPAREGDASAAATTTSRPSSRSRSRPRTTSRCGGSP